MLRVRDAMSFAAAIDLSARLGRRVGPSTGTNFVGVLRLARELACAGQRGSIVALICDAGERYAETLFDAAWQRSNGIADESLRLTLLDGPAIDALESADPPAMGKSAP